MSHWPPAISQIESLPTEAPLSIHAGLEIQVFPAKFLMNSNSTGHRIARWSKSEQRKCLNIGAPGEIRTPGLLVRSQALYPTELRAQRLN
jgi:hypothetical protein